MFPQFKLAVAFIGFFSCTTAILLIVFLVTLAVMTDHQHHAIPLNEMSESNSPNIIANSSSRTVHKSNRMSMGLVGKDLQMSCSAIVKCPSNQKQIKNKNNHLVNSKVKKLNKNFQTNE